MDREQGEGRESLREAVQMKNIWVRSISKKRGKFLPS